MKVVLVILRSRSCQAVVSECKVQAPEPMDDIFLELQDIAVQYYILNYGK